MEKLRREQVEEDFLIVLQQKEFEEEQRKHEEPDEELGSSQEVLTEAELSPSKGTGLPEDFKFRLMEISVGQEIGSGGFATIHKCRRQNYEYAMKIFNGDDVDCLRAEVENLVLLRRHPNIVQLVGYSIHKTDGRPMLVMELLDSDLHDLICTDKLQKRTQLTSGSEETSKKNPSVLVSERMLSWGAA